MSHGGAGAAASVPVWPPPHLTQTSHTFIPIHNQMHRMVVMLDRPQLEHVYTFISSHEELETYNKMMRSIHMCNKL